MDMEVIFHLRFVVVVGVRTRALACVLMVYNVKLDLWGWLSDLVKQAILLSLVTEFSVTYGLVGVVSMTRRSRHNVFGE